MFGIWGFGVFVYDWNVNSYVMVGIFNFFSDGFVVDVYINME